MKKYDEILEQYTDKNKITEIFELINKNKIIKHFTFMIEFYSEILKKN
ncbi:MAG: hypothetical protein AABW90_03470 [Nanoarchaeota archaeon]